MILGQLLSRRWIFATFLVVAAAAVCVRLGIWQLDRLAQRRASNAHYIATQTEPPLSLPRDLDQDLAQMEYRAVTASGHYDFSQQVALRNQVYRDQFGLHLLTPLVLDDGRAVLVDRGWIPAEGNDQGSSWSVFDEPAEGTISGIIRASRVKADLSGQTDPPLGPGQRGLDSWLFPNIPRLQAQVSYRLLPVYIQLSPVPNDTAPPIPYQPEVDLTEGPHQGYAIQWFTFATILLLGYPFYVRRHSTPQVAVVPDPERA